MKIKGLIIGSLLTTLAAIAHAQPETQAFRQNCAQNPDLFLTIKSGLANTVTIMQMQSFFQVNGTSSPINAGVMNITGNVNSELLVAFANSACLQQNEVFSVGIEVKSLITDVRSTGGVPLVNQLASSQPAPGVGITPPRPVVSQTASQINIVQLPTTTLPVNCIISTNQIRPGTFTKTISFDPTTQTYFCV